MSTDLEIAVKQTANVEVLRASHSGILHIGNEDIKCWVLECDVDEEPKRVLSGRAVTNAFGLTGRDKGMTRFLVHKRISSKMSDRLKSAISQPMLMEKTSTGLVQQPHGFEAWILPELCFAILDANDESPFPAAQQKLVAQAKILMRGFALTGITALVDEATGYQEIRDRLALQKILAKYISKEILPYYRMFPDDFYKELFRLLGWQWKGMSVPKPSYIGKLTIDLVYERLAPGVLAALKLLVPRTEKGHLKYKMFQHLTEDEGRDALAKHLHALVALMKAATTWKQFQMMVERAYPKYSDSAQLVLHLFDNQTLQT